MTFSYRDFFTKKKKVYNKECQQIATRSLSICSIHSKPDFAFFHKKRTYFDLKLLLHVARVYLHFLYWLCSQHTLQQYYHRILATQQPTWKIIMPHMQITSQLEIRIDYIYIFSLILLFIIRHGSLLHKFCMNPIYSQSNIWVNKNRRVTIHIH